MLIHLNEDEFHVLQEVIANVQNARVEFLKDHLQVELDQTSAQRLIGVLEEMIVDSKASTHPMDEKRRLLLDQIGTKLINASMKP